MDLSAELETGTALSLPSPDRFSASSQLVEVATRAIHWPGEREDVRSKKKDERFLPSRAQPQRRGLLFYS